MKIPIFTLVLAGFVAGAASGIEFRRLQLSDKFYAEGAAVGDFNKDGKQDVISGPYWYAGPELTERTAIYETKEFPPKGYSKNFNTWAHDINGDGWDDVVRVTFPGEAALWYENPKGDGKGEWKEHVAADVVENESPQFGDIDGDGRPELVCSAGGKFYYAKYDPAKPTEKWAVHPISGEKATGGKFTHGLGLGDVDGDGRIDLLDKDHWFQQPASLEGDPLWKEYRFQFSGPGGADMFAYDFDGDGDNDIYTSAAAHSYGLTWFEQAEGEGGKKIWKRHVITGAKPEDSKHGVVFSQAHAAQLVDMDGDGVKDLITGKRWWAHNGRDPGGNDAAVLYWFKVVRGGKSGDADFVPHLIDDNSGIGTQFVVEDLDGDSKPDIVVGNKKGSFIHFQAGDGAKAPAPVPAAKKTSSTGIFRDGDRVVLLGNTFFEREGGYGYLETALSVALAGRGISFRNMGWSGDTVDCHARSYFGPAQEGFDRLKANLQMAKPTLVIACYGANAAFDGESGKAEFVKGYKRLLGMVAESTGARLCVVSPPPAETLAKPLPDMAPHNARLASYRDAIKELADAEKIAFVDLFKALGEGKVVREQAVTDNGIHFSKQGYAAIAPLFSEVIGFAPDRLASEGHEELRALVVEKNRLFFNRWRPQNETYLRGFRKHEQGQNAKELSQFDPLVDAKDKAIQTLALELSK